MGKLKNEVVIPLQEQAENLGFSTIQEALDAGFVVDYTTKEPTLVFDDDKAIELAHEAWEREKEEVLEGLKRARIINNEKKVDIDLIKAIKFIEGVSHE